MKKIVLIDSKFEWMCVYAMRYALKSRSSSTAIVTRYITGKLLRLSSETLHHMIQDIAGHPLGDVLNAARWQDLCTDIEEKLDRRRETNNEPKKKNARFTRRK